MDTCVLRLVRDYTLKMIREGDAAYDLEARLDALMRAQPELTRDMALEEVIADALPAIWSHEESVRMLMRKAPVLAERIRTFLHEFVQSVRKILERISAKRRPEAQTLRGCGIRVGYGGVV